MNEADLQTLLHDAAAIPSNDIDLPATRVRARQLHRRGQLMVASGMCIVLAMAIVLAVALRSGNNDSTVQTPATSADPRVFVDTTNGMTVRIPSGWHRDVPPPETGLQRLSLRSAAQTTLCDGSRTPTIRVNVMEIPPRVAPNSDAAGTPRPTTFGPDTGRTQIGSTEATGCFATKGVAPGQGLSFMDKGRAFQVILTRYPAPANLQAQAYAILNSLQFLPNSELHRPPLAFRNAACPEVITKPRITGVKAKLIISTRSAFRGTTVQAKMQLANKTRTKLRVALGLPVDSVITSYGEVFGGTYAYPAAGTQTTIEIPPHGTVTLHAAVGIVPCGGDPAVIDRLPTGKISLVVRVFDARRRAMISTPAVQLTLK